MSDTHATLACLDRRHALASRVHGRGDSPNSAPAAHQIRDLNDAAQPQGQPRQQRRCAVERPEEKASASLLITFETNSAELTAGAKQQLDVVAAALKNDRLAE